jgi:hypothetical protein
VKPFRIQVSRLIDFGAIVTLIGVDAEASKPVTVHVDYRPFDVVWAAWRDIGSKQPIEYAADGLTLSLGVAGMITSRVLSSVRSRPSNRQVQTGSAASCCFVNVLACLPAIFSLNVPVSLDIVALS